MQYLYHALSFCLCSNEEEVILILDILNQFIVVVLEGGGDVCVCVYLCMCVCACACSAFCLYGGFTVKHFVVCLTQDLMVDENIMKLEVKRLRDMLNDRSDEVMSQEKRKLQLETVSKKQCCDLIVSP